MKLNPKLETKILICRYYLLFFFALYFSSFVDFHLLPSCTTTDFAFTIEYSHRKGVQIASIYETKKGLEFSLPHGRSETVEKNELKIQYSPIYKSVQKVNVSEPKIQFGLNSTWNSMSFYFHLLALLVVTGCLLLLHFDKEQLTGYYLTKIICSSGFFLFMSLDYYSQYN